MQYLDEQARLERTFKIIESELLDIGGSIDLSNEEIKKQSRDMWENAPAPSGAYDTGRLVSIKAFLDDLAQQNRALEFKKKRYSVLMKMLESAYFGRVDFKQEAADDTMRVYIGIGTLSDENTGQIVVFDWRAPICSLFYDAQKGPATYMSPNGPVNGEMLLRRQYKIEYDRIVYLIDAQIKIDDEILMRMLSQSADNRMKTIVTTIQKEQNRIIRDASNDVMIATGPAGSGKTSVALHRIAYILYREREKLSHKDILILTPNDVFSDYISTVLPQLGEENVRQTTISACLAGFFPDYTLQAYKEYMEVILGSKDKMRYDNISIKCSFDFARKLDERIVRLKEGFFEFNDIIAAGKVLISSSELKMMYEDQTGRTTPLQRLDRIKNRIVSIIKRERIKEFDKEYKGLLEDEDYYSKMDAKRQAKLNTDKKFAPADQEISRIENRSTEAYYLQFIKSEFPQIYMITKDQLDKKYLLYEDIVPFAYFMHTMGHPLSSNGTRHVIIDELQDHSYLTVKLISRLFKDAKFTMVGDENQSLSRNIDAYDPQTHTDVFGEKKLSLVILRRCYRSTYEIYQFCSALLSRDPYESSAVKRHGEAVKTVKLGKEKHKEIFKLASAAFKDGFKSVAIITKTIAYAKEIITGNPGSEDRFTLIEDEDMMLGENINVLPSYYAKGLEFDCVVIPDADRGVYDDDKSGRVLYTVCSRALHRLIVCYSDIPARGIQEAKNPNLNQM